MVAGFQLSPVTGFQSMLAEDLFFFGSSSPTSCDVGMDQSIWNPVRLSMLAAS